MGNRKERRRAALSTAGRRVKLDLFTEPSGELGGSSVNENGGGDKDSKHSSGSPKPSSSDLLTKNPLLLLGQYTDDDEDEESNGSPSLAAVKNAPKDRTDQVTESTNNISDVTAASNANVYETDKAGDTASPDDTEAGNDNQETAIDGPNLIDQNSIPVHYKVPESSDLQVIGDVSSGWKMVRHEATNQCYYWNVETGETSWEVPQIIPQADEVTTVQKLESSSEGVSLCNPSGTLEHGSVVDGFVNQGHANTIPGSGSTEPHSAYASSLGAYYSYQQSESNVGDWNSLTSSYGMVGQGAAGNLTDDLSSRVTKFGEYLLERLRSLKGSTGDSNGQEWISKYILEVEIRLADIKSLLSYGSALLPFWVHSEGKLRQLGEAFNYEVSQLANTNNVQVNCVFVLPNGSEKCTKTGNAEMTEDLPSSDIVPNSVGTKFAGDINVHSAYGCSSTENISENVVIAERDVNDADRSYDKLRVTSDSNRAPGDHTEDYMDMDVDMEVEEPTIPSCIATVEPASQGSSLQHMPLVSGNELNIPHPPDEGWIPPPPPDEEVIPPPPPPDNENFPPPPPPDDPPEPSVQPPAYSNPYNAYAEYTYRYYDQTVAGVTPQAGVYYEVPNSYVNNAPVMANSAEPVLYYDPQGVEVQAPPVLNGASPGSHISSGLATYNVLGETGLSCSEIKVSKGIQSIEKGQGEVPFVIPAVQAQPAISTQKNVSSQGTDSATVAKATVSKGQLKASRVKKRTSSMGPSMRSNKKVSILVDKWKAAKEELQDDEEDEPEDSYEALEKKRQREIEEWRAKVIASGEAKDNANFQPLGGDWRERIKRRRAQLIADAPHKSTDETKNGKQERDLIELANDLPPGWQVHWDESSKQVYYSNIKTSATTWIRPVQ